MISAKFLKNNMLMKEYLKASESALWKHRANSDTPNYIRKETKFLTSEICKSCKEKFNLKSDKFIKEK